MLRQELLVIDPQHDFCNSNGKLFVGGADKDMERLAKAVKKISQQLWDIHVTLDCHHLLDIAHPLFWIDKFGKHPGPFTIITEQDVKDGVWYATIPELRIDALKYVVSLASNARYHLCIWPPHCLIGSLGGTVVPSLFDAFCDWEKENKAVVDYVTKGSNFMTEHYSAVMADVPDPSDPGTQLNTRLINILKDADKILIAGEALSHCLANTIRDIANNFGEDNIKKFVLLEDCTSNVGDIPGSTMFKDMGDSFVKEMTSRGMQICKSTDL
jgi:nicotinamidase-related amidase